MLRAVHAATGSEPGPLRVGIVYETFGTYPRRPGDPDDFEAEYEPEATIEALEAAISRLGHSPVRVGSPRQLLEQMASGEGRVLDAALSIAEGYGSRNREGWAPSLLEMAGVPALGSDALTLGLCLDKAWTLRSVAAAGVRVAAHSLIGPDDARHPDPPAEYPLFVKPRWEGTAKGIAATSRVNDAAGLEREVRRVVSTYAQPALVEQFVPGPEYTVCVVGHRPVRALPVLQRALDRATGIGLHAVEREGDDRAHHLPGELAPALEAELQEQALRAFGALECLDFARVDFRLDEEDRPVFLEINPLPTFAPDGSFGILAELEGMSFADFLAPVFGEALARLGF